MTQGRRRGRPGPPQAFFPGEFDACIPCQSVHFGVLSPSAGFSQSDSSVDSNPKVRQRLQEVEALKKDLLRKMQEFDNRIHTLEAEMRRQKSQTARIAAKASAPPQQPLPPQTVVVANPPTAISPQASELSDFNVKVFGKATLDGIYNTARPQAPGFPAFLVPKFANGFPQNTIDINARQSMLGVAFTGPMIGDFQSGGKIAAQFFDPTIFADRYGFLLTQAYGEFFNKDWRFAAGLQLDVWAPVLPTALPFSVNGSGVANTIRGQARVERFIPIGGDSQLTLQAALSEPVGTIKTPDNSLDEDNGRPNAEGRIAFGLGKPAPIGIGLLTQRPLEVGVSGVVGQLRRTAFPPTPRRVCF